MSWAAIFLPVLEVTEQTEQMALWQKLYADILIRGVEFPTQCTKND